jgi:nucleoid DNA-binding protein
MNKKEFLTCLSGKLPYDVDGVDFIFDIISDILEDGLKHDRQVKTPIGTFKVVRRKPHRIKHIHTREYETLPAKNIIKFTPSKRVVELLESLDIEEDV